MRWLRLLNDEVYDLFSCCAGVLEGVETGLF